MPARPAGWLLLVMMIVFCWSTFAFASPHHPSHRHGPTPRVDEAHPTMRVVHVLLDDPACGDHCPEWISAEGMIDWAAYKNVVQTLTSVGDREIPILIQSRGGDVDAAIAIARLIRIRHLDVIVARTQFSGCGAASPTCPEKREARGRPAHFGAICASACSVVLAGGEHRFVPAGSIVGIHSVRIVHGPGGSATTGRSTARRDERVIVELYERLKAFLRKMDVSDRLVESEMKFKPSEIHWMSRGELLDMHLVTSLTGAAATLEALETSRPSRSGEALASAGKPPRANAGTPSANGRTDIKPETKAELTTKPVSSPATDHEAPRSAVIASDKIELASVINVTLNSAYAVDLTFFHHENEPFVDWSMDVRQFGQFQPGRPYSMRVEFGERLASSVSISASFDDPADATVLHGKLSLSDYCELAGSDDRLRLTRLVNRASWEIVIPSQRLLTARDVWPDCPEKHTTSSNNAP